MNIPIFRLLFHELESILSSKVVKTQNNIIMITPPRKNMEKIYSDGEMKFYMKIRRRIETAIGQLVEKFNLTIITAHSAKNYFNQLYRKIMAYNFKITLQT